MNEYEKKLKIDFVNRKIDQYNSVITQFSKYSFSIKQLCVTIIGICVTFFTASFKDKTLENLPIILLTTIVITFLFYVIDCFTYYYQDVMQQNLFKEEVKLYHLTNKDTSLSFLNMCISKEIRFSGKFSRLYRCIFSFSNLIYLVVIVLFLLPLLLIKHNYFKIDHIFITIILLISFIIIFYSLKILVLRNEKKEIVFVSYTTKDPVINKHFLFEVKKMLWIDYDTISFIDLLDNKNKDVQKEISKQIKKSNFFLLIDTENVRKSEWVNYEFDLARKQYKDIRKISPYKILNEPITALEKEISKIKRPTKY